MIMNEVSDEYDDENGDADNYLLIMIWRRSKIANPASRILTLSSHFCASVCVCVTVVTPHLLSTVWPIWHTPYILFLKANGIHYPMAPTTHHQCIIIASSLRHHCIITASSMHHHFFISVSSVIDLVIDRRMSLVYWGGLVDLPFKIFLVIGSECNCILFVDLIVMCYQIVLCKIIRSKILIAHSPHSLIMMVIWRWRLLWSASRYLWSVSHTFTFQVWCWWFQWSRQVLQESCWIQRCL